MSNKLHNRIRNISSLIAEDFVPEKEVTQYIEDENRRLYLFYDDTATEYSNIQVNDPNLIKGFLTVRIYQSYEELDDERMYADSFYDSEYYNKDIFPITNLVKMSVSQDYQSNNIGTKLYGKSALDAYDKDRYPMICRMWKKSNGKNGHIERAKKFGGNVIDTDDYFVDSKMCNICGVADCDCSNVVIVFDN